MKSRATLILRLPSSLHQQLKDEARAAEMSLNKYCQALLRKRPRGTAGEASPVSFTFASGRTPRAALLQELSALVLGAWGGDIEALAVFGSFARGRETSKSDIDLLIVLSTRVQFDRDVYSRWRCVKMLGHEVAPLFVKIPKKEERIGGLWYEVALDGIVLFDRELLLSRFLSHVRELIAGGLVRRMVTHGHPYWVHSDKPVQDLSLEKSL